MSRIVTAIEAALLTAISICWNVVSHNGMVTLHNTVRGTHKTFRIFTVRECHIRRADKLAKGGRTRAREMRRFPEYMLGKRVAQVLTGPDRDTFGDWYTFGTVVPGEGVRVYRRLQGEYGRPSRYDWAAKLLNDREFGASKGVHYHIEGRCSVCNRPITHPSSLYAGKGPICRGEENRRVVVDYSNMTPEMRDAVSRYEQLFNEAAEQAQTA